MAEGSAHPQRQSSLVDVRFVMQGVTRTWGNVKSQMGKSPQQRELVYSWRPIPEINQLCLPTPSFPKALLSDQRLASLGLSGALKEGDRSNFSWFLHLACMDHTSTLSCLLPPPTGHSCISWQFPGYWWVVITCLPSLNLFSWLCGGASRCSKLLICLEFAVVICGQMRRLG